jgi:hypothetical protein
MADVQLWEMDALLLHDVQANRASYPEKIQISLFIYVAYLTAL